MGYDPIKELGGIRKYVQYEFALLLCTWRNREKAAYDMNTVAPP